MTVTRTMIALLLLCSSAFADGPLFSIWHIDGHGYQWQQAQIDAGLPIEPSIRMPTMYDGGVLLQPTTAAKLDIDAVYLQFNGRHIALRMNNIGNEIDKTIPRVSPLTEDNYRTSHMCVRRLPDGSIDDTPIVCPFAGTAAWAESGRVWATAPWTVRLQQIIPEPAGVILRENNEGGRLTLKQLWVGDRPRRLNSKGTVVYAEVTTPPASYVDATGAPLSPDWTVYTGSDGMLYMYRWKTDAELDTIDLRAKEWVAPRRSTNPADCQSDWTAMENAQYRALYAAFDANLSASWQGKLRTVGYGGWTENRQNDAASPAMYLGFYRDPDLTKPGAYAVTRWDGTEEAAAEAGNPKAWREYSIAAGQVQKALYTGAVTGRHAVVDPASFAGLMTHVAWRMQSPGREVRLVYWDNYNIKPTHFIFGASRNSTTLSATSVAALTSIDREDMLTLTIADYEVAVMQAFARIHNHPILERYWREGTTVALSSPLNTSTATKVFATETTIPGERATLLCVYTPCDLVGEIQAGGWTVPVKRFGYWLTGSVQEIE